jgi:iron-sulfur cluster repair protein YtfE (RIC family)
MPAPAGTWVAIFITPGVPRKHSMTTMNTLSRKLSPSAVRMIRMDHTHVLTQFHKLAPDTSAAVRGAILRSICAELEIHAQLEEEIFYPALSEADVLPANLAKSLPEHDEMRRLIARVRSETARIPQDDALNALMNAVMHHVADEETQLLPAAERLLRPDRLAELGAQMTARRIELARPRAAELAKDMAMAAPGKTALMAVGAVVAGSMLMRAIRGHHYVRV